MTEKTLYLHIGLHKTGSSALQTFFARNIDALAAHGLCYPEGHTHGQAVAGHVTSGNATSLYHRLLEGRLVPTFEALLREVGEPPRMLLSTEAFASLSREQVEELLAVLSSTYRVRVICFVRDVYPLLWSGYGQAVKRRGATHSFHESVVDVRCYSHLLLVDRWAAVLPSDALSVLHYESCRDSLPGHFLRAVGLENAGLENAELENAELENAGFETLARRVNRGIGLEEVEILRELNAVHRGWLSTDLSDRFLQRDSDSVGAPYVPEVAAIVKERFAEAMADINRRYFGGQDTVQLGIPDSSCIYSKDMDAERQLELYRAAATVAAEVGATHAKEAALARAQALQATEPKIAYRIVKGILEKEPGFEPAVKLATQLALLDSRADP